MHALWDMRINLTLEELDTLRSALDRALKAMESELVHTDAIRLQHAIAADYERLRMLRHNIIEQTTPRTADVERPSHERGL